MQLVMDLKMNESQDMNKTARVKEAVEKKKA